MNVQQITSQLAMMPDQALQKYAMMHRDDPYVMALAISESKRRKEMRAASAMQNPAAQPQPKVADQALQEMAPAGVAALPTHEMNFADGGIVAFADGGITRAQVDQAYQDWMASKPSWFQQSTPLSSQREAAAEARYNQLLSQYQTQAGQSQPGGAMPPVAAPASQSAQATPTASPAPQAQPAPAAGGLGATPEAAALQKTAAPMAAPAISAPAPSVQGAKESAGQFLDTAGIRSDLDKYQQEVGADIEAQRARRAEGKPGGQAYSKFEESLQQEEAGAAKEKDEATGVAIFKAGLAMMAGTSPRAFENIGKGAMAGLDEYSGAMKDMKKAAKERQKAFADIEQARRAESREDWKTANDYEDKASARLDKARETGIRGIMDITGKNAEIAAGIYKTQVQEQGATQRANLQANATIQAAGMRGAGAMGADKQQLAELKALQSSLQNQLKTEFNKDNRTAINAQLAQVNAAIAQMAGIGTMPAAPGAPQNPGGTPTGWGKASVVTP